MATGRAAVSPPSSTGRRAIRAVWQDGPVSPNKRTVETYIDGFNKSDHAQILSCLTDDIEWTVFGFFRVQGKDAYDREIENAASPATRRSRSPGWSKRTTS